MLQFVAVCCGVLQRVAGATACVFSIVYKVCVKYYIYTYIYIYIYVRHNDMMLLCNNLLKLDRKIDR